MTYLFWFRRDLRVQDNEALSAAVALAQKDGHSLAAVYNFAKEFESLSPIRRNSLITSVESLGASLPQGLSIARGTASTEILAMAKAVDAKVVFATRSFDTQGMLEQAEVAEVLYAVGISLHLVGSN